jgi:hypothetical protein
MLVNMYLSTQQYIPEDSKFQVFGGLDLIFWPVSQERVQCHTEKSEPNRRVSVDDDALLVLTRDVK